jgi:hypothetical protein
VSTGFHTVHVRINDAATGQPTPVRIRFAGPEGKYLAPFGRLTEFATGPNQDVGGNVLLGMKPYAYIDGSCEIRLPAGPIQVEISKGPEYLPQRLETVLSSGKLALRFTVERWTNLRAQQWYSGDTRAHFLTPHGALLEGMAEDLAVVNLLAVECRVPGPYQKVYPAVPNLLAFSGQSPVLEKPGYLVVVNTHNTHPVLGSLGLLNCHRVVYPLAFGGPAGREDWTLADWCDQCHRKGGLVVATRSNPSHPDVTAGEWLADLVRGQVDAFEIDFFADSPFDVLPDWYTLLNAGVSVPLVGASGKTSNGIQLGSLRTYARLQADEPFTYRNWIEAVRAGRTFVTNGPILSFRAAGQGPGETLGFAGNTPTIPVRAEAHSTIPFDHLEVIANGVPVATVAATGSLRSAILENEVALPAGGWLAARCRGDEQGFHRPANERVFAHTSPVYVRAGDRPPPSDPAAVATLIAQLGQVSDWLRREGRFDNDDQRDHLLGIFAGAREILEKRASG